MSDHGARIIKNEDSNLSVIYAYKDKQTKYKDSSFIIKKILLG